MASVPIFPNSKGKPITVPGCIRPKYRLADPPGQGLWACNALAELMHYFGLPTQTGVPFPFYPKESNTP